MDGETNLMVTTVDALLYSESESENEVYIPVFFVHSTNEALSMWVSNAETHMFQLGEHIACWDEIKGPMFEDDTKLKNKKKLGMLLF